jgi:peptidoglycan/xylan/chitin deacetylase (PgdA/CDA1 family)
VLGAGLVAHALPSVGDVAAIVGTRSPRRVGRMWLHSGPGKRAVALTFGDGPSPETTPRVVRQLGRLGLRATFFVTGTEAVKYPELIVQIEGAGHALESHGMEHRHHLAHRSRWIFEDTRAAVRALHDLGVRLGTFDRRTDRRLRPRWWPPEPTG